MSLLRSVAEKLEIVVFYTGSDEQARKTASRPAVISYIHGFSYYLERVGNEYGVPGISLRRADWGTSEV